LDQLNALLDEYAKKAPQLRQPTWRELPAEFRVLSNRLLAAIDRLTVPTSTYARAADQQRTNGYDNLRLSELAVIATALRDDIQAGWLASVVEIAHADTHSEYLEMAEELLTKKYKDAAAVIAGTSLEVHLHALCTKHSINLQAPNGSPKKADTMNADLKAAGVYNTLEQKQVTAWLAIRNSAANGNYGDYDEAGVKGLIEGVRNFAAKYSA
jgi:hypothetical protein